MNQVSNLSPQEFADHIMLELKQTKGRIVGLHFVLNSLSNGIRDSDPELASRIANEISERILQSPGNEYTTEVVEAYLEILLHGGATSIGVKQ